MNKQRTLWGLLTIVAMGIAAGCGGNAATQKATDEQLQAFQGDPSKMPADAQKKMQEALSKSRK